MKAINTQSDIIKSAERKEQTRLFTKTLMAEFKILNYLSKFRVRYEKKKMVMAEREKAKLHSQTFSIDESRKLEIEEEILGLRANINLFSDKCTGVEGLAKVKSKVHKLSYNQVYVSFYDDVMLWKKKNTSSKVEGKIYLSTVEQLLVEGDVYIIFVSNDYTEDKVICLCFQVPEQR